MQYESAHGLRREHTFDEVRRYIQRDPDVIKYPKRDALFLQKSHIYGQAQEAMRSGDATGQQALGRQPKPQTDRYDPRDTSDAPNAPNAPNAPMPTNAHKCPQMPNSQP